jgi:8-oxo-dGTP diphosphatase
MDNRTLHFAPHAREYRFCPHCATALTPVRESQRARPTCPACGFVQYLNPPLATTIILPRGNAILMERRTIKPRRGFWTLPGGYVELGESAEEAVVREAREEVGVDVRVERLLGLHSGAPSAVAVALFEGTILAGEPQPLDEVDAVGFFAPDEMPEVAFWSTHWAIELWRLVLRDRALRR